ncbi:MAG: adenylate kinase [Parachlamydiales bacterium]|jgi:adenylate kinase
MKNIILLFCLTAIIIAGITVYRNSKKQKPLVVILMGPPGSGKGTQALDLAKKLKIPHISTGDLFRENIKNKTALGLQAKELIDKGALVPDNIVVDMLFDHIYSNGYDKTGYILDGFPRTINQAAALDQRLGTKFNKIAINLSIDDAKLLERITGRLICKSCSASFHKIYFPPKNPGICDHCSGELYQRADDTEEVLKSRLEVYYKDTKPLIEYYNNKKELFDINSNNSKEVVFDNLVKTIDEVK